MNAPFLHELVVVPAVAPTHRRAIEVEFLAERYHRAFDEEARALERPLALLCDRMGDVLTSFERLRLLLAAHERLQERQLFPAYEHGATMSARLFDAWMSDNAVLADAAEAVRHACRESAHLKIVQRVLHFIAEVERHLADEIEVLATWAGSLDTTQPTSFETRA